MVGLLPHLHGEPTHPLQGRSFCSLWDAEPEKAPPHTAVITGQRHTVEGTRQVILGRGGGAGAVLLRKPELYEAMIL